MHILLVTSLHFSYLSMSCKGYFSIQSIFSTQTVTNNDTELGLSWFYCFFAGVDDSIDLQEVISKGLSGFDEWTSLISEVEKLFPVSLISKTEHGIWFSFIFFFFNYSWDQHYNKLMFDRLTK